MMYRRPSAEIAANHSIIAKPNTRPMRAVPRFCTRKRPARMKHVMITTNGFITVGSPVTGFSARPSTAESTEMAGVMTPSP